jgi:hypothetical protein
MRTTAAVQEHTPAFSTPSRLSQQRNSNDEVQPAAGQLGSVKSSRRESAGCGSHRDPPGQTQSCPARLSRRRCLINPGERLNLPITSYLTKSQFGAVVIAVAIRTHSFCGERCSLLLGGYARGNRGCGAGYLSHLGCGDNAGAKFGANRNVQDWYALTRNLSSISVHWIKGPHGVSKAGRDMTTECGVNAQFIEPA